MIPEWTAYRSVRERAILGTMPVHGGVEAVLRVERTTREIAVSLAVVDGDLDYAADRLRCLLRLNGSDEEDAIDDSDDALSPAVARIVEACRALDDVGLALVALRVAELQLEQAQDRSDDATGP